MPGTEITKDFEEVLSVISQMKNSITILQNKVKLLEKEKNKKIKKLEKELEKKRQKRIREPSGFAKPMPISKKLCEFLNKPAGSEVARTEVTQHLISYIKQNNLQNQENKSFIKPDKKLSDLLNIENDDKITYFNIQGFMNQHFLKEKDQELSK